MMKYLKFIITWLMQSLILLACVPVTEIIFSFGINRSENAGVSYSAKDTLLGIVGESLRALILCYLFPMFKNSGKSYLSGIHFGLLTSALIASIWLIIGYGSFELKNPGSFVLFDGVILLLQGLSGGAILHWCYKKGLM
jgi:hypothetical protein